MTSTSTDPDSPSDRSPRRPSTICFGIMGVVFIVVAVADWIALGTYRTPSTLVGAFGIWLLATANRPKGKLKIPLMVLVFGLAGVLMHPGYRRFMNEAIHRDRLIVQRGTYPDLCPNRTIQDLLAHGHAEVEWTSYKNKYGHRSVRAVCLDADRSQSAILIWTIDDDDNYWIQFTAKDGKSVQPYDLLETLCRNLPSDVDPTVPPTP